jgi:hypothetical protein
MHAPFQVFKDAAKHRPVGTAGCLPLSLPKVDILSVSVASFLEARESPGNQESRHAAVSSSGIRVFESKKREKRERNKSLFFLVTYVCDNEV